MFWGNYIGDFHESNISDFDIEWISMSKYFGQEEEVEKLFTKYKVYPQLDVKMKVKFKVTQIMHTAIDF